MPTRYSKKEINYTYIRILYYCTMSLKPAGFKLPPPPTVEDDIDESELSDKSVSSNGSPGCQKFLERFPIIETPVPQLPPLCIPERHQSPACNNASKGQDKTNTETLNKVLDNRESREQPSCETRSPKFEGTNTVPPKSREHEEPNPSFKSGNNVSGEGSADTADITFNPPQRRSDKERPFSADFGHFYPHERQKWPPFEALMVGNGPLKAQAASRLASADAEDAPFLQATSRLKPHSEDDRPSHRTIKRVEFLVPEYREELECSRSRSREPSAIATERLFNSERSGRSVSIPPISFRGGVGSGGRASSRDRYIVRDHPSRGRSRSKERESSRDRSSSRDYYAPQDYNHRDYPRDHINREHSYRDHSPRIHFFQGLNPREVASKEHNPRIRIYRHPNLRDHFGAGDRQLESVDYGEPPQDVVIVRRQAPDFEPSMYGGRAVPVVPIPIPSYPPPPVPQTPPEFQTPARYLQKAEDNYVGRPPSSTRPVDVVSSPSRSQYGMVAAADKSIRRYSGTDADWYLNLAENQNSREHNRLDGRMLGETRGKPLDLPNVNENRRSYSSNMPLARVAAELASSHQTLITCPLGRCPRAIPATHYSGWYTLKGLEKLRICPSCKGQIDKTPFRQDLRKRSDGRVRSKPVCCSFSDLWIAAAWKQTVEGLVSLNLVRKMASLLFDSSCPSDRPCTGRWYRLRDPVSLDLVKEFAACSSCVQKLGLLLPAVADTLVPSDSSRPVVCDLRSDSSRFSRYIELFSAVADSRRPRSCGPAIASAPTTPLSADSRHCHGHGRALPPFFDDANTTTSNTGATALALARLVGYVHSRRAVPVCERERPTDGPWHVIRGLPEFTVCQDCYLDVVEPLRRRGRAVAALVSPLPVHVHAAPDRSADRSADRGEEADGGKKRKSKGKSIGMSKSKNGASSSDDNNSSSSSNTNNSESTPTAAAAASTAVDLTSHGRRTCQLYSERMRTIFADAARANNVGLLIRAVCARFAHERRFQQRRDELLLRQQWQQLQRRLGRGRRGIGGEDGKEEERALRQELTMNAIVWADLFE